jgi:uncharacterized membrane protein required for colicin V production
MTGFNWIDGLLILLVLLSVAAGWGRGFILSLLDLARWVLSLLAALFFYQIVAGWLGLITDWTEVWTRPAAFLIVFVVTGILIQLLGNALLRRIPKDVHERRINRVFGMLPGFVNGLITAAIVSALLSTVPFSDSLNEAARQSTLANRFAVYTDELETAFSPIFDPALRQTIERLKPIQPGSDERSNCRSKSTTRGRAPTSKPKCSSSSTASALPPDSRRSRPTRS